MPSGVSPQAGRIPAGLDPAASSSSRRATPRTATSPPTPPWCWPRRRARTRARSPSCSRPTSRDDPRVAKAEVAGPGFINLTPQAARSSTRSCAPPSSDGDGFGRSGQGAGRPVNVEFVSANPTGPMHVGHGRGAVFGDALANLLAFAGHAVTREYYINDAGAQVDVLARSAFLRYREALGEEIGADPGGALPGRLPQAGRRGARARARRRRFSTSPRPNGCRSSARPRSTP